MFPAQKTSQQPRPIPVADRIEFIHCMIVIGPRDICAGPVRYQDASRPVLKRDAVIGKAPGVNILLEILHIVFHWHVGPFGRRGLKAGVEIRRSTSGQYQKGNKSDIFQHCHSLCYNTSKPLAGFRLKIAVVEKIRRYQCICLREPSLHPLSLGRASLAE